MIPLILAVHDGQPGQAWHRELAGCGRWSVLGPATSLADAGRLSAGAAPALLVADLHLRDGNLLDLMRLLQAGRQGPRPPAPLPVLVLVQDASDPLLLDVLLAGADSFFMTSQARPGALTEQALGLLAGDAHIAPPIARRLLDHFKARGQGAGPGRLEDLRNPLALTADEWSLLCELSVGDRLGDLARRKQLPPRTLTDTLRGIYRKMQWALRAGDLTLA